MAGPTRNRPLAPETNAAQALHYLDMESGAVAPPIHPSSTFARNENYDLIGFNYSRYESPTINLAERIICSLEGGAGSLLFATGLAAMAAILSVVLGCGGGTTQPPIASRPATFPTFALADSNRNTPTYGSSITRDSWARATFMQSENPGSRATRASVVYFGWST